MLTSAKHLERSALRNTSGDKVVFKNIEKRYKFLNTVTVEYILSPKIKTSTHDYIGIYPRDWKDLRDFVGFDHPMPAPYEEPNLYRCITFKCQPPHVTANLYQDYQFVYVHNSQEVLGRSNFFQFVEENPREGNCQETNAHDHWFKNKTEGPEEKFSAQAIENSDIQLTPYEIAYNECYFRNKESDNRGANTCVETGELRSGTLADASNTYSMQKETSNAGVTTDAASSKLPLRRVNQRQRILPRRSCHTKERDSNTGVGLTYSKNWLQPKQHLPMTRPILCRGDVDVKCGAIPKHCPKCFAPLNYNYEQQQMQHQLDQAHFQIRDLRTELDGLRNDLQISQAAHAKLQAVAEMSKFNRDGNFFPLNNFLASLVSQLKLHVVNCHGSPAPAACELESPIFPLPKGSLQGQNLHYVQVPSKGKGRNIDGRNTELKAMIGCQERTIQALHIKLLEAEKLIEAMKTGKCDLTSGSSNSEGVEGINTATKSDSNGWVKPCTSNHHGNNLESPNKEPGSIASSMSCGIRSDGDVRLNAAIAMPTLETFPEHHISHHTSGVPNQISGSTFIVKPKYFHVEPAHSTDYKVVVDDDETTEKEEESTHRETNNNNYETKDLNCDNKGVLDEHLAHS